MSNENRKCFSCQGELEPFKVWFDYKNNPGQSVTPTIEYHFDIPSGGSQARESKRYACKNCKLVQEYMISNNIIINP